jgi:hypothetical protein
MLNIQLELKMSSLIHKASLPYHPAFFSFSFSFSFGKNLHGWEILVTNSLILFKILANFENENEKKS